MSAVNSDLTFATRDEFQRKAIAEKLITLLKSDIDISPMVIDGGWGTGKTEFCHKLINLWKATPDESEQQAPNLIYVDAFQADHADEPLMTVLSEVLKLIPEGNERNKLVKKALPALRFGLKTAGKAVASHLLRQESADMLNDFDKELQKTADKAIDASVESMLTDHIEASKSLKSLREALEKIATDKPIVMFIDELDRCKPDFAVRMLEVIKHTFEVKGVQFVLITNTQQLRASINHCYGSAVDAQRYLDKFLKFRLTLPQHVSQRNNHSSFHYYIKLIKNSSILNNDLLDMKQLCDLLDHFIKINQISLREIETFVKHLEIYQTLTNQGVYSRGNPGCSLLNFFGILLSCFKPEIATRLFNKQLDAAELADLLGEASLVKLNDNNRWPKPYQALLHFVGKECAKNSQHFIPSDEDQIERWEKVTSANFPSAYLLDEKVIQT